jgi:tetratricopeptide (TPR) repeat protein
LKALEINKRSYGENHVNYARNLENLSSVLHKKGEYEGAKEGYLKALEINKRSFGENHVNYAKNLENLSNVLLNLGDYEVAKEGY